mmetsp:Transcript_6283/g.21550  ORF Transcript_6283/g.21550 Transcript_6283/m.21550 type:complete len:381 (+) Transcript_6283:1366-2508(+)
MHSRQALPVRDLERVERRLRPGRQPRSRPCPPPSAAGGAQQGIHPLLKPSPRPPQGPPPPGQSLPPREPHESARDVPQAEQRVVLPRGQVLGLGREDSCIQDLPPLPRHPKGSELDGAPLAVFVGRGDDEEVHGALLAVQRRGDLPRQGPPEPGKPAQVKRVKLGWKGWVSLAVRPLKVEDKLRPDPEVLPLAPNQRLPGALGRPAKRLLRLCQRWKPPARPLLPLLQVHSAVPVLPEDETGQRHAEEPLVHHVRRLELGEGVGHLIELGARPAARGSRKDSPLKVGVGNGLRGGSTEGEAEVTRVAKHELDRRPAARLGAQGRSSASEELRWVLRPTAELRSDFPRRCLRIAPQGDRQASGFEQARPDALPPLPFGRPP